MKYHCGHLGCDICGARECNDVKVIRFCNSPNASDLLICESCTIRALKFAIQAAETFGGIIIDFDKPCGSKK